MLERILPSLQLLFQKGHRSPVGPVSSLLDLYRHVRYAGISKLVLDAFTWVTQSYPTDDTGQTLTAAIVAV